MKKAKKAKKRRNAYSLESELEIPPVIDATPKVAKEEYSFWESLRDKIFAVGLLCLFVVLLVGLCVAAALSTAFAKEFLIYPRGVEKRYIYSFHEDPLY